MFGLCLFFVVRCGALLFVVVCILLFVVVCCLSSYVVCLIVCLCLSSVFRSLFFCSLFVVGCWLCVVVGCSLFVDDCVVLCVRFL